MANYFPNDTLISIFFKKTETFWDNDRRWTFWPILDSKWPESPASEALSLHTSKSSSIQIKVHVQCESNGNRCENSGKPDFFYLFWANNDPKLGPLMPNFYTLPNVALMSLQLQFHVNPLETFEENSLKPQFWPIFSQLGVKKGPEIWTSGIMIYIHLKVPAICP